MGLAFNYLDCSCVRGRVVAGPQQQVTYEPATRDGSDKNHMKDTRYVITKAPTRPPHPTLLLNHHFPLSSDRFLHQFIVMVA